MSSFLRCEVVPLEEVPPECESFGCDRELRRPLVLIVDDEPLVADTLSMILSREGFATMTAYDGETALDLVAEIEPDLLISDVAMPGMSGIQLAMDMAEAAPACRVLLFSGHATHADLNRAYDAGYDFPLLAKPVHPMEMLRQVRACLGMQRPQKRPVRRAEVIPIRGALAGGD